MINQNLIYNILINSRYRHNYNKDNNSTITSRC